MKLFTSIIISISIILFFILILPSIDKTKSLISAIREREIILRQQKEIISRIEKIGKEIEENKENVNKLDLLLPKKRTVPDLIASIEAIAGNSGVVLEELSFSETSTLGEEFEKLVANLTLNGSYETFLKFLDSLEKNIRIADLIDFSVARKSQTESQELNFRLRFNTYYLK